MSDETALERAVRRETEEMAAAGVSINAVARERHIEMAKWYALQAASIRHMDLGSNTFLEICDGPPSSPDVVAVLSDQLLASFGVEALSVARSQAEVGENQAADMWRRVESALKDQIDNLQAQGQARPTD